VGINTGTANIKDKPKYDIRELITKPACSKNSIKKKINATIKYTIKVIYNGLYIIALRNLSKNNRFLHLILSIPQSRCMNPFPLLKSSHIPCLVGSEKMKYFHNSCISFSFHNPIAIPSIIISACKTFASFGNLTYTICSTSAVTFMR